MPKQIQTIDQRQSLSMTASMHQSISVLQMSNIELAEFARNELDKNPFLEDANVSIDIKGKVSGNNELSGKDNQFTNPRREYQSNFGSTNAQSFTNGHSSGYSSQDHLENIAEKKTLKTHVLEQINLAFEDSKEILIAHYLLDYLQPSGYLNVSLQEVSENLKCHVEMVQHVLNKLQKFDPAGIFARNLKECLKIQLRENGAKDQALIAIVNNLDLLAKGDLKKLSKIVQVNINNLGDIIKQIKLLNPKPGNGFLEEYTSFKIPDVTLDFDVKGNAIIEISSDAFPKLRVNEEYYTVVKDSLNSQEEKDFTQKEIESASIVVKSIEQRGNTILKIASAIVEEQMNFFKRGIMYLKPMTLNDIAIKADLNESTVSRSTSNKYISTPSGIYELKYFFSSGLASTRASSQNVSSTKVKELIKQIIMAEEQDEAFSDDEIAEQLKSFSVSVARRTVAKYRELLDIPPASKRKKNRIFYDKY